MTKPVTIPNTFATATTAIPLSNLDADFSTVATALNDANTYSNYAPDTGSANAYVVTLSGVSTTYSAGLRIQFKAGNANTTASTLNVNGGGAKNITYQDATAIASGTIAANSIVDVMYDGTQFLLMNDPAGATGGDVVGPSSATDNAIVRFDGTTGKLVQNSVVTIADSTGDVSGVGQLNATTVDATNIEVTNIKAKDGTAAASIADSTGVISITSNPVLSGGTANGVLYLNGSKVATSGSALTFDGTALNVGNLNLSGNTLSSTNANGNIVLAPNGTGDVQLDADMVRIGDSNANATLTTNGTGDLILNTNSGTNSGSITIADGANGDMTLTPNGNGSVVITNNGTSNALRITQTGSGNALLVEDSANPDSTPFAITSEGRLIVGGTSSRTYYLPGYSINYYPGIQSVGGVYDSPSWLALAQWSASTTASGGAFISLNKSNGVEGTHTIVNSGQRVGGIGFGGSDGTKFLGLAEIYAEVDGTPGTNDMPGRLTFYTTADGASSPTERMRLDSSGNLGLGVTPSAWSSNYKAIESSGNSGVALASANVNPVYISSNWYNDGNNKYKTTAVAALYEVGIGAFKWYTAPSGTAGTQITFTQAMTLDASGNLLVGYTSGGDKLTVNGNINSKNTALFYGDGVDNSATVYSTAGPIKFAANATERARITSGGNFKIGGTADRGTTEGDKQLVLFNGTAPVGTLTNGISLYSSSGEAYVMDAAGNATLFSPHDRDTNEWIFRSKHTPSGKVLKIDVERLLRFVNDHFGLDAVQEFIEP